MNLISKQDATGQGLLSLLQPRGQGRLFSGLAALTLVGGWLSVSRLSTPVWVAAAAGLGLLAIPAVLKWRADYERLGAPLTVLSVLLVAQALHTIEHVAQWSQYHLLGWPLKASSGLISPLNAEVVHFSWNLGVLLAVAYLLAAGQRSRWMWLLGAWAGAHTAEHIYLFVNYLQAIWELRTVGLPLDTAQGQPGFFGAGGWLATNAPATGPVAWLCQVAPGLVEAPRLDVHFWWNAGELAFLLPAAHTARRTP
ncbi:MAG: hypothetical protein OHK0015_42190 [Chloroflexi bacterium OHK40]